METERVPETMHLKVIHVLALINISLNKTNKFINVKNYIFYAQYLITAKCFDLPLIAFRELLNINKAYIKHIILKLVYLFVLFCECIHSLNCNLFMMGDERL